MKNIPIQLAITQFRIYVSRFVGFMLQGFAPEFTAYVFGYRLEGYWSFANLTSGRVFMIRTWKEGAKSISIPQLGRNLMF